MSDEDDIEDQADLDDAFYDDDVTDLSETTVDEALATNFDRKSSRQMLEERLEQKKRLSEKKKVRRALDISREVDAG